MQVRSTEASVAGRTGEKMAHVKTKKTPGVSGEPTRLLNARLTMMVRQGYPQSTAMGASKANMQSDIPAPMNEENPTEINNDLTPHARLGIRYCSGHSCTIAHG